MLTKESRSQQTFLRNEYDAFGKWNMPIIRKNELDVSKVSLISLQILKLMITTRTNKRAFIFILTIIVWTDYIITRKNPYKD